MRERNATSETQRITNLEHKGKDLRWANEILTAASTFFAEAELDRRIES